MKQILHFSGSKQLTNATSSWYYSIGDGVRASLPLSMSSPWVVAGSFSKLKILLDTAPGTGKSVTYTLIVNGSSTALTVTISDSGLTATDSTHTVSISAGDDVCLERSHSGTPTLSDHRVYLEFDSGADNVSGYSYATHPSFLEGFPLFPGYSNDGSSEVAGLGLVPIAGDITGYQVVNYATNGSGRAALVAGNTLTFNIYKNGVKQDGSGGTVDTTAVLDSSNATDSWSGTLSVDVGDAVYLGVAHTGGTSIFFLGLGTSFAATTDGEFILGGGTAPTSTVPSYTTLSTGVGVFSNTESAAQGIGGPTTFYITGLSVIPWTASGASAGAYTAVGRVNASTPDNALVVAVTGTINPDAAWGVWGAATTTAPLSGQFLTVANADRWDFGWSSGLVGTWLIGSNVDANVTTAVVIGVDGVTHLHEDPNVFAVYGNAHITGDLTVDGTADLTVDINDALDALGE